MSTRMQSLIATLFFAALSFLTMGLVSTGLVGCLGAPDPLPARPTALAGLDQFGTVGIPVLLDGRASLPGATSASTTPSTVPLTYIWSFADLPAGSLLLDDAFTPNQDGSAGQTSFVPDRPGLYVVQLLVAEGDVWSVGDFTTIEVDGSPEKPVADAGPDQTIEQGMAVYLDGSRSHHPDGVQLYYRWTLAGRPSLSTLSQSDVQNAYTPYPSLILDTGGVYTLALVVSDGLVESDPDYVFVTAESLNTVPVAKAGPDRSIQACTDSTLDGSSSYDVNGDPLQFGWEVLLSPLGSSASTETLGNASSAQATLSADKLGSYVVQLTVSDGASVSVPDVVNLTAVPRAYNTPPLADAGEPLTVSNKVTCSTTGSYCPDCPIVQVPLDGSGSSDADLDRLTYAWNTTDASQGQVIFLNANQVQSTAELHGAQTSIGATVTTTYQIRLTVTDCPGATGTSTVEIKYLCTGGS